MNVQTLNRGSAPTPLAQAQALRTTRRSSPAGRMAGVADLKRQRKARVERVVQIHREWIRRHGRPALSR